MTRPIIIALDGHDASGKTTLSKMLATKLNGKYIKPFSDSLGDLIAWSFRNEKLKLANDIALAAVEKEIQLNQEHNYLIFDRHWLTMFTVLPQDFFSQWQDKPTTILCWADVETTNKRLDERDEPKDQWCNEHYCKLYKDLAEEYGVFTVNTSGDSDIDERLKEILDYLHNQKLVK